MPIEDLRFRKTARAVVLEGTARPGALIKLQNASAAPMNATWQADRFTHTRADARGHFHLDVPAGLEGDQLRVQADDELWQVVRVQAGGTDQRRAEFNPQGLRLVAQGPGVYGVETVSADSQASEPGTVVRVFNLTSQHGGQFKLDAQGHLPAGLQLGGQPGEVLALACSDGVHNADFQEPCGFLVAPPGACAPGDQTVFEPGLLPGDDATLVSTKGPLFVDGASAADAVQGVDLGDCYLVATAAALAQACPKKLEQLIKANGDGTYTVAFKRFDAATQTYVAEPVTVTDALPTAADGQLRYGTGADQTPGKMELWFPILEKAYAAWKGGYTAIINGFPYEVFEATLGKTGTHFDVRSASPDALFHSLHAALARHQPVVAWTAVDSPEVPFSGTRLAPDHAYTVLDVSDRGGQRTVTVRNPFGTQQPAAGPEDHGVSTMSWATFLRHYVGVGTVAP